MWPTSLAKPSKRPPLKRAVEDGDDWFSKGVDDMRARHPMFRMPNWMSDDNDVSNLASRISHSPHFSSLGRRGNPWRERRNSGGSAMSGGSEEDCVDSHYPDRSAAPNAVRIPIRIEAEAPPGCEPVPPQHAQPQQPMHQSDKDQKESLSSHPDPPFQSPHNISSLKKQPFYASKTTSAVDALKQEVPRTTRCSSAPPDMNEQIPPPHRFVSKTSIIPQNPAERPLSTSPVFNNIAKPFVSPHRTQESSSPTLTKQDSGNCSENQQDSHHFPQQKPHTSPEQFQQQQAQPQNQFCQSAYSQQPPPQYQQQPYSYPQHQHSQQPYTQQHQSRQPHQQWDNAGHKSSIVRNIPIIFEGRDEDKRSDSSAYSKSPPNPHENSKQYQQQSNRPQRDNFFSSNLGFVPSHVQSNSSPSTHPHHFEHPHSYPQSQPHFFQRPQQSPSYPTKDKEATPPSPEQPRDIKMDKIATVRESVSKLQEKVQNFESHEKNKEFLYIDEMLTRALLELDDIDPDGRDDVRQARRTLVKDINTTISNLEKLVTRPPADAKSAEAAGSDEQEKIQEQESSSTDNKVKDSVQPPIKSPSQAKLPQPEGTVTGQMETDNNQGPVQSETPNPTLQQQTSNEEISLKMQCDEQNTKAVENGGKNMNGDSVSSETQPATDDRPVEILDSNKSPLS